MGFVAVQPTVPSLVTASTLPSLPIANTSAIAFAFGTATLICETPEAGPGTDHSIAPSAGPVVETVTSVEAPPAVIVAVPSLSAVNTGGSAVETVAMVASLDAHVRPLT